MFKILLVLLSLSFNAGAVVNCDCDVVAFPPTTGPHRSSPIVVKTFALERLDSTKKVAQRVCRRSCLKEYRTEISVDRLNALLLSLSQELIYDRQLGYNCTGLTTLKYPIKVRARLGEMSLGYVEDIVQVVNHEQKCF